MNMVKNIMIYPAPASQKKGVFPRYEKRLKSIPIKCDKEGRGHIGDGYDFFRF